MSKGAVQLYQHIRNIDYTLFELPESFEVHCEKSITPYSRYVGTEFDRSLKKILDISNSEKQSKIRAVSIELDRKNMKLTPNVYSCFQQKKSSSTRSKFSMKNYLSFYSPEISFSRSIKDESALAEVKTYLIELHEKVSLTKLNAKESFTSNLKINISYLSYELDLMIDNAIIDIKTDIKAIRLKREYIAQLLLYYLPLALHDRIISKNSKRSGIKLFNVEYIGIYYAQINYLHKVSVNKIFPHLDQVLVSLEEELVRGNRKIKQLLQLGVKVQHNQEKLNALIDAMNAQIELDKKPFYESRIKYWSSILKNFDKTKNRLNAKLHAGKISREEFIRQMAFSLRINEFAKRSIFDMEKRKSMVLIQKYKSQNAVLEEFNSGKINISEMENKLQYFDSKEYLDSVFRNIVIDESMKKLVYK